MSGPAAAVSIYTRQFWLVCVSSLLFFASFNMIIPELPAYLSSLGGADYKGLIISLFTLTAMVSRPFSGKLSDRIGRVPVMMVGSTVCFLCSLVYPLLTGIYGFFLLRLVHGFSTGFTPTGQTAFLSDIVPPHKRGEAMGFLGTAGSLGMAGGPAIGGLLAHQFSVNATFYCSSIFGLLSILILAGIKETLPTRQRFNPAMLKINRHEIIDRKVLVPCFIMLLCVFAFGAVYTLMPDFGEHVGINNKGLLFTYFTIATLLVRFIGGRASDQYGRVAVLRVSTFFIIIALLIIGMAESRWPLIIGMSLYGLAYGITSPVLLAWATDLTDVNHKGKGVASLYIFMELGIGLGAITSAWIYDNDSNRFFITFALCAFLTLTAFIYLVFRRRRSYVSH
ncbi:MAG: MFS transporter [Cyclobacteriaceae bacterium]